MISLLAYIFMAIVVIYEWSSFTQAVQQYDEKVSSTMQLEQLAEMSHGRRLEGDEVQFRWTQQYNAPLNKTRFSSAIRPQLHGIEKIEIVFNRETDRMHEAEDLLREEYYQAHDLSYPTFMELYRQTRTAHIREVEFGSSLSFIKLVVELKHLDVHPEKSKQRTFEFSVSDIDFETDPLFPRLDITKYVAVMGDYFQNKA